MYVVEECQIGGKEPKGVDQSNFQWKKPSEADQANGGDSISSLNSSQAQHWVDKE